MQRDRIDMAMAVLNYLEDGEYHTITATTKSVAKYFHLSKDEMNEIYYSREKIIKNQTFSSTKIYTQVQLIVTLLRNAKFLKDFPGTKGKGIFSITNKGSLLLTKSKNEIRKSLNAELKKYYKKTTSKR